jgi:hypothetical protein
MHLLYVDESGHASDPKQEYFVLAGISVFERRCWWISNELDQIAARFDPANPQSVELHGSPMLQGRGGWKLHKRELREQAMIDALAVAASNHDHKIFAAVVKKSVISPRDPVVYAFEQLTSRFDQLLGRKHKYGDTQRGIILFDKCVHEHSLQNLARDFREVGHTWGVLRNLSEVPVFLDSRASRLIQLADLIAYAVFRRWEMKDHRFYNVIRDSFDKDGGICHGLHIWE